MTNKIAFRPVKDSDLAFIINRWMHESRYRSEHYSYMSNEDYKDYHKLKIVKLLAADTTCVRVAYAEPEKDWILGFVVFGTDTLGRFALHHIHVEKDLRRLGLARKLLTDVCPDLTKPIVITQFHKILPPCLKKWPQMVYNPLVAMAPNGGQ